MDSPIGELALLRRQGTIDEFGKRFIALSCRDTTLTEPQQVQLFITSLGDPLALTSRYSNQRHWMTLSSSPRPTSSATRHTGGRHHNHTDGDRSVPQGEPLLPLQ